MFSERFAPAFLSASRGSECWTVPQSMKRMTSSVKLQSMSGRITALVFVLFSLVSLFGCGLNDQERAVAQVNVAIKGVDAAGNKVAAAISAQEGEEDGQRDIPRLRDSVREYLEAVDTLNGHIRALADVIPAMNDHIRSEFMPSSEKAARDCQKALDLIDRDEPVDDVVLREAITQIGACIDQYAVAVTEVSTRYGQVSE